MAPSGFLRSLHFSKRQFFSYVFDWIIIIALAGIGWGLSTITPHYRAFSVIDLSISFPNLSDTVSTTALALASLVGPAIIIFGVCFLFVPGPTTWKKLSRSTILRRKLWEWNVGWMGLALSLATALLVTQGVKNIIGKPRPSMLAVCMPDLDDLARSVVGGYGQNISNRWVLVNYTTCDQKDPDMLNDAFRSFPSGHASISWGGLLYLSLWLCSKFGVRFPTFSLQPPQRQLNDTDAPASDDPRPESKQVLLSDTATASLNRTEAAPPTYLLFLLYVPIGAAIYITGSRFFDYKHHGVDLLAGALIGALTSVFSFRYYHLPLTSTAAGWGWAPRSPARAWAVGVGTSSYVEPFARPRTSLPEDPELGQVDSAHDP